MLRRSLLWGAGALVGIGGVGWWQRNAIMRRVLTGREHDVGVGPLPAADANVCTLTPEQVEGPYFIASPVRRDVREDRVGLPLDLTIRVVQAESCQPVVGAVAEIWHCDAAGRYSGFREDLARKPVDTLLYVGGPDQGPPQDNDKTYLRGAQASGTDGRLTFRTILPGWYEPRVPHIHLKVHTREHTYLTTQLYFEETLVAGVYAEHEAYQPFGQSPYVHSNDLVIGSGPNPASLVLSTASSQNGLQATCTVAVA